MIGRFDFQQILINFIVLFFGIGLHEFAHCRVATLMGDPTPKEMGRDTLNLFKHFDPAGTMMIVITSLLGIGIGWGKPAPMIPERMRNPRWGFFLAVIAGPLTNLAQASVYLVVLKVLLLTHSHNLSWLGNFCLMGIVINISLACFNLIPLGPLDGHWLVGLLMPPVPRQKWFVFNQATGSTLLLFLIIGSQIQGRQTGHSFLGDVLQRPTQIVLNRALGIKVGQEDQDPAPEPRRRIIVPRQAPTTDPSPAANPT